MKWLLRRRRLRTLLVFLLLGAIINVAVAWFAVVSTAVEELDNTGEDSVRELPDWPRFNARLPAEILMWKKGFFYTTRDFRAPGVRHFHVDAQVLDDRYQELSGDAGPFLGRIELLRTEGGWPTRSLAGEYWIEGEREWLEWAFRSPYVMDDWLTIAGEPRLVPLAPVWPSFAINTLFYAAILWMLHAAPFAVRRRRRINRGLCPTCAYPVGASAVCTECGKPH